ncbi:hypothetical protein [Clostridium tarantellae]|uniref:hypothetical protein n=1 Tax=Clostridium tarantellae TaxID=39493 RepID=UPI00147918A7|nr:hypothetical protein [Clostridium tarantellae]
MSEYFIQKNEHGQLIICKVLAEFNEKEKSEAYNNLINLKTGHITEKEIKKTSKCIY